MPLYEFLCESCGRRMEVIQSFSDPPPAHCDRCGGNLKKLLSAPAVQFKGSGWYVSDYGKGSSGGAKSDADKSDKSDKKDDGKKEDVKKDEPKKESTKPAESKTETKSETKSGGD